MKILVVNAGSSSLKYQLFDMETGEALAKGVCERIGIDAEIACAVEAWESTEARVLSSVSFGQATTAEKGSFVVCYPSSSDSLWSVAKRYGTALSGIRAANGLDNDVPADCYESIEGHKYLIV